MTREELLERLRATRRQSVDLARPLRAEDYRIQSMPDVSPPWWNLGHTTWFFAKNVLEPFGRYSGRGRPARVRPELLLRDRSAPARRDHRGLVTRPTTDEVYAFRERSDERLEELIAASRRRLERLRFLVITGIQHEQQHQELLVTEVKHILGTNVPELREPYLAARRSARLLRLDLARREARPAQPTSTAAAAASVTARRVRSSSQAGSTSSATSRAAGAGTTSCRSTRRWLDGFALAEPPGHQRRVPGVHGGRRLPQPLLWLSNGWAKVRERAGRRRSTGRAEDGGWQAWTLAGVRAGRSRRAGLPRELLRGRRLRPLEGARASRVVVSLPPSASGSTRPASPGSRPRTGTSSTAAPSTPGRRRAATARGSSRWGATSGSGPRATTSPTPATGRSRAP